MSAKGTCGGSLAKFILLLINLLFILIAMSLILFGSRLQMASKQGQQPDALALEAGSTTITLTTLAAMCITIGAVLGVISLFGFGATICESTILLNAYGYFLMICVVMLAAVYIGLTLLFTDATVAQVRKYYVKLMANYSDNQHSHFIVDHLQSRLFCCGDLNPEDWHNASLLGTAAKKLAHVSTNASSSNTAALIASGHYPISCCGKWANETVKTCPASELIYFTGCFSPVQVTRYQYFLHASFIALIAAVLLLLAISCCLERDHQLQQAKLCNMQFAAHLETCTGTRRSAIGPPPPSFASHYRPYPLAPTAAPARGYSHRGY